LVERKSRGIVLTQAGRDLHPRLAATALRLESGLAEMGIENPRRVAWQMSPVQLMLVADIRVTGTLERVIAAQAMPRRAALRAIAGLESLLGSGLLEQESEGAVLSGLGNLLADRLGSLPREIEMIVREHRQLRQQGQERIMIGVAPDPGTAGLTAVIRNHVAAWPRSTIEIVEANQIDLAGRLAIGEIDLLVGHLHKERRSDLDWRELGRTTFVVAARKGHPLATRRNVPLHELAECDWLVGTPGSDRRKATDITFSGRKHPLIRLVTSAAPLMAQVLQDCDALALMTERELARRSEMLVRIAYDLPRLPVTLALATRPGWEPDPCQRDFIEQLAQHCGGLPLTSSAAG
jgi:DNA-binding transcriptional LysR family regulator